MLTRRQLAQIAMRHDTSMSRAMLRALGLDARRAGAGGTRGTSPARYRGMCWCFANHASPMDRAR